MASYLAQVILPHVDAAESADCVNTFHFRKGPVQDNFTFIQEMVEDFYTRLNGGLTVGVSSYLSPRIRRDVPAVFKIYDDNALDPGGPIHEGTFPLLPSLVSSALVEEVALCASFRGVPIVGMRSSSAAGRVYIGPLNGDAQQDTNGRPSASFIEVVRLAMIELHAASNGAGSEHPWVVYSPTLDKRLDWTGPTDFVVVGGHVDNAFDTQRRRGLEPTTRSIWGT